MELIILDPIVGNNAEDHNKRTGWIIPVGIILIGCYWLADAVLDSLAYNNGTVIQQIISPDRHEISTRLLVMLLLVLLLNSVLIIKKRKELENELRIAVQMAETEKEQTQAIVSAMGDGLSIHDTELKIIFQNQSHKEMMGDHSGELCYAAFHHRDKPCEDCHLLQSFQDGNIYKTERTKKAPLGTKHVEILSSPLRDQKGNIVAGIELVRDITERKRTEDEIQKLNADLSMHAAELSATIEELEAFSYSVSHDLRTPLTRIYSSSQALMDGYSSSFDDNGTFFVQTIHDACEQMEELIESLLTFSRVTNSEMEQEEVNLSLLAREIAIGLQQSEPERRVVFDITPNVTAHGDSLLLKVVLENLLGNAWKFTKMRNEARIEFGVAEAAAERVYFVRDNGAGFDMKNAANLFKPFQRLHNPSNYPGSGVGLATVQRIIQRHGGRVWGEGAVDQGAVLYFTLK